MKAKSIQEKIEDSYIELNNLFLYAKEVHRNTMPCTLNICSKEARVKYSLEYDSKGGEIAGIIELLASKILTLELMANEKK